MSSRDRGTQSRRVESVVDKDPGIDRVRLSRRSQLRSSDKLGFPAMSAYSEPANKVLVERLRDPRFGE